MQSREKLSVAIAPKRRRHAEVAWTDAFLRSQSVTAALRADRFEAFLQPVGEQRHAKQVLGRALVGALARRRHGIHPFRGVVVAAADPGERDQFGGFIDIEVVDQLAQFFLGQVFRTFLGKAVMVMIVVRVAVELDLVFGAVGVVLVDGGTQRLGLEDE
ncbi:mll2571 [Mesorhizobium japonicum MAFF 303099]|uniref:Mll2571 protein n=1 Tax=Mesorhizobium japonicum (strain LMG 29417 / CECT 9101 / MAFF 303099) TaxID=266835 RepID=Q98I47_RHILO|nr:mll2571 [Mesorhizobium japonicum MAFF 303099]